jgi:hypothetical protein
VITWSKKANRRRLPKAAVQREPPATGSRSSNCLSRLRPARSSQNPDWRFPSSAAGMDFLPETSSAYANPSGHADFKILPTDP